MSSTHCFLRTENQSICHGVARLGIVLKISHTFQRKGYNSQYCAYYNVFVRSLFAETIPHNPKYLGFIILLLKFNIAKKCNNSTGVRMHRDTSDDAIDDNEDDDDDECREGNTDFEMVSVLAEKVERVFHSSCWNEKPFQLFLQRRHTATQEHC